MKSVISDNADRIIGLILVIAAVVLGSIAANYSVVPKWVAICLSVTTALGGLFNVGVTRYLGGVK